MLFYHFLVVTLCLGSVGKGVLKHTLQCLLTCVMLLEEFSFFLLKFKVPKRSFWLHPDSTSLHACCSYGVARLQGNTIPSVLKFHGLITTFEMIMADCPELRKLHWRCVVIDEAHRLKNKNCKLLEGLKLMNLVSLFVFRA